MRWFTKTNPFIYVHKYTIHPLIFFFFVFILPYQEENGYVYKFLSFILTFSVFHKFFYIVHRMMYRVICLCVTVTCKSFYWNCLLAQIYYAFVVMDEQQKNEHEIYITLDIHKNTIIITYLWLFFWSFLPEENYPWFFFPTRKLYSYHYMYSIAHFSTQWMVNIVQQSFSLRDLYVLCCANEVSGWKISD